MNCYIHVNTPAVATCHDCGMGLCRDCAVNSAYTKEGRPLCHDCNLKEATNDLADAKMKRIMVFGETYFRFVFFDTRLDNILFYRRCCECLDICGHCGYSGSF